MPTISTYNDNTIPDDGSKTDANQVKFATIKTDLTDPLHSWIVNNGFELGADVASASSLGVNIEGVVHDVTGTTTIVNMATSSGTTPKIKILQFDGALTVEHSSAIGLPGGESIVTQAGDVGVFYEVGNGNWKCVSFVGENGHFASIVANSATVSGALTVGGASTVNAEWITAGLISPAQITASQNNYAPTGIGTANTVRIDADAAGWNITGLSASQVEGREITLENDGTVAIILADEDTNSTAANRFALPNSVDTTLEPESSITLKYDGTASRWRVKGAAGSGGGAKDAGGNTIGFNHDQATAGNYTLVATENMVTAGTFTITSGDTVTIASGARWVIV